MATFKLTIKRGQKAHEIVRSNGSVIAGSDALELNIDTTSMSKLDVVLALRHLALNIQTKGFPQ